MSDRTAQSNVSLPPIASNGRYEVATRLGEGGMATVYRALDRKTGEWCALKVLLAKLAERPNIRARFAAEAEAMSRINHRNVIHVFDVGTNGARPFFAMELAEGGCLVDWIEAYGPMPARMACDVAIQICKGIGAAHRQGVIHRDIKPHNILVNRRGVCKITDFGIAQFDDDAASLTQTGSVMGTLGYIAPEQRANAKDVDERTDIYSIGATLYTLLTARTTMDLFFADQEPEMLAGITEALVPIVLKSTRYRRDDRYESVRAMAKALYHAKGALPEDPPDTPSIILKGEPVEGTALPEQDSTFEPGDRYPSTPPAPPRRASEAPGRAHRSLPPVPPPPRTPVPGEPATPIQHPSLSPHAAARDDYARPRMESMPPLPREALLHRRIAKRKKRLIDWGLVVRRALAISIPTVILLFLCAGYGMWGGILVEAERLDAKKTLATWLDMVEREQAVTAELAALGAEAAPLEGAWSAMTEAEDPFDKARHANAWLELAKQQLAAHAPSSTSSSRYARAREVQGRLTRLDDARATYLKQRVEWQLVSETRRGRFAVWLGLVTRPPAT